MKNIKNAGAKEYSKVITEKIVPYIDEKYTTKKKSKSRSIVGISHGRLLANYIFQNHSDVFENCSSISPSFWVADFEELKKIKKHKGKVYIFTGTKKWQNNGRRAVKAYQNSGYELIYYEGNNEMHHQNSWRKIILDSIIYFKEDIDKKGKIEVEIEYIYGYDVDASFFKENKEL